MLQGDNNRSGESERERETFIAIANGIEVDVDVVREEEQTEPRVERVDRYDEENAHDPTLLRRTGIPTQMLVDLQFPNREDDIIRAPDDW